MKILAFVDLHGSLSALKKMAAAAKKEKVEYIVCAGDITIFGDAMDYIVKKFDEIGIPVLMLHGNHEGEEALRKRCKKTKNVKFMHKEVLVSGDHAFMGYGGGGFAAIDEEFTEWSEHAVLALEGKKIVLFTHAPPYDTKLDKVLDQPAGNKSIRFFIEKHVPVIAISGHLHENSGMKDRIGKTKLVNPGPWGLILEV
ncbi:metallophosphoesterase family protein [Candidatus Woesearchaeota archaeon]|nr:metallophosphoesterase family protein [Candidatus Woesearchaeota archaeon]